MARQFNKIDVTFERTLTQRQTVTVSAPEGLSEQLAQAFAEELAPKRLKERGWEQVKVEDFGVVNGGIPVHAGEAV